MKEGFLFEQRALMYSLVYQCHEDKVGINDRGFRCYGALRNEIKVQ